MSEFMAKFHSRIARSIAMNPNFPESWKTNLEHMAKQNKERLAALQPPKQTKERIIYPSIIDVTGLKLASLPLEMLVRIASFLPIEDVLNLSICSKYFHDILFAIKFTENVRYDLIFGLSYFDSFTDVTCGLIGPNPVFPKSLRKMKWCYDGQRYPSPMPESLTHLELGKRCTRELPELPSCLEYLKLGESYNKHLPELPNTLTHLILSDSYKKRLPELPDSLTHLVLGREYNRTLPQLPSLLTHLILGEDYNRMLPHLPDSLLYLKLSGEYNHPLPPLPNSLTHLILGEDYDQPLPSLPSSLKLLQLSIYYTQILPELPNSLEILKLSPRYNQILPSLPDSLKYLYVSKSFNLPKLPPNVAVEFYGEILR